MERHSPFRFRRTRTAALGALLLLLALSLTLLSLAPSVADQKRPTAQDIAAARNLIHQVKASQERGMPARLSLEASQIGALAILAGEASGFRRVETGVDENLLSLRASVPLPGGLWINTAATVAGTHDGFPGIHLKVGRVVLPAVASRWSANFIRWLLLKKGVELPPLDEVVRHFSVTENAVTAELALPPSTGLVERLVSTASASVDDRLVAQIYCRLARAQEEASNRQLVSLVRQAFLGAGGPSVVEYNRAALVAISFYVVGEQAHRLAPTAAERSMKCPPPAESVLLWERADLAKHWAFSAAITAVLGQHTAVNLGEWKELHDSLPSGSGFSFVDLAADRSGLHVARRALDRTSASPTAQALRAVSEEDLLPNILIQAPEGLNDGEFVGRFGGLGERRYRAAVVRIDQHLGHWTR
jgi:hypothetical protein